MPVNAIVYLTDMPWPSPLAGRAPVRHPLAGVVIVDARSAATARLSNASVHPQLSACPGVAGGAAVPPVAVGPQHAPGSGHQPMRVGDRSYRRGWQMSADETQFVAIDIADAGQHALVQQRLGDRSLWVCRQVRGGDLRVPVVAQKIRPKVCHRVAVMAAVGDFQYAQVDPDGAD